MQIIENMLLTFFEFNWKIVTQFGVKNLNAILDWKIFDGIIFYNWWKLMGLELYWNTLNQTQSNDQF